MIPSQCNHSVTPVNILGIKKKKKKGLRLMSDTVKGVSYLHSCLWFSWKFRGTAKVGDVSSMKRLEVTSRLFAYDSVLLTQSKEHA